jgi:hypothetical protein
MVQNKINLFLHTHASKRNHFTAQSLRITHYVLHPLAKLLQLKGSTPSRYPLLSSIFYLLFSAFFALACAANLPFLSASPAETTPPALAIEVTVVYLGNGSSPVETPSPAVLNLADTITPGPLLLPTDTPVLEPTATPIPAQLPLTSTLPLTSPVAGTGGLTSTTAISGAGTPEPPIILPFQGSISLVAPDNYAVLPSNANELEVKWLWQGNEPHLARCETIEGYGFEVRIMPARDGFGFLGAMDAAKNKEDAFLSCDPDTGIRTYMIKFLKDKPGVKVAGAGKFLWDAALVQLEPYKPVITPIPRLFEISFDYQGSLDPFGLPLKCADFNSWAEAQAVFLKAGGPAKDPHGLDPDGNGEACEDLK